MAQLFNTGNGTFGFAVQQIFLRGRFRSKNRRRISAEGSLVDLTEKVRAA